MQNLFTNLVNFFLFQSVKIGPTALRIHPYYIQEGIRGIGILERRPTRKKAY